MTYHRVMRPRATEFNGPLILVDLEPIISHIYLTLFNNLLFRLARLKDCGSN